MSNPIKPSLKTEILPVVLVLTSILLSFYFYSVFPDQVPIHWNFAGEVDGYGSKATASFLFPAIILGTYLLFLVLPIADPKKERYHQFKNVYHRIKAAMVLFMFVLYILTGLSALGFNLNISAWISFMVGVLFVLIGNYLGKVKPNWFMGIRTPWTLSSEEVWNKTHRLGAIVFVIAGLAIMIVPYLPNALRMIVFLSIVILMVLLPIVYSYILFSKEQNKNSRIKQ